MSALRVAAGDYLTIRRALGYKPSAPSSAVECLERHGVVVALDDQVLASRCARHLDELGPIGI